MTTQRLWRAIHVYPWRRGTEEVDVLMRCVRALLPCGECRKHFDAYLAANPPDTSSSESLFAWGVAFHNAVNARLNKPLMSLDDARKRWQPCSPPSP